ncbi:hypothetical protein JXD20_01625 [Candidatus Peregrinibacteria bacterium]|nr:hypothetical protein [Candidatus Peregrinibacteria bacterium]
MGRTEQINEGPGIETLSALKIWARRALLIAPLLAAESGCHSPLPKQPHQSVSVAENETVSAAADNICWNGMDPNDDFDFSFPNAFITKGASIYFKASKVPVPELRFEKIKNDASNSFYLDSDDQKEMFERRCRKNSYEPLNVIAPKSLEVVTISFDNREELVPIYSLTCQLVNDNGYPARGLYTSGQIFMQEPKTQDTIHHEACHAYLDMKWADAGISPGDRRWISAGRVFSETELKMAGLESCEPVNMLMANETVCYAFEESKRESKTDTVLNNLASLGSSARFALGMNAMSRIASVLKNGNRIITKENFREFDPYHLLNRASEWIDEPWAENAISFVVETSPVAALFASERKSNNALAKKIAEQYPFLQDLNSDVFEATNCSAGQLNPSVCQEIETSIVEEVNSRQGYDREYIHAVIFYLSFRAEKSNLESVLDSFYEKDPNETRKALKIVSKILLDSLKRRGKSSRKWLIDILEKYDIDTQSLRDAID